MRAHEVFGQMTHERAAEILEVLREKSPGAYGQALAAASAALKARPRFIASQPAGKRAQFVRRALARVSATALAEEVLAAYFLDARKALLVEWLDAVGVEHQEGTLEADHPPSPPANQLREAVKQFLAGDGRDDRELLLRAFAAQRSIDWPELEATFAAEG